MRPARAVVINLARRTDRLAAFQQRWQVLPGSAGVPLDVFTAIDTGSDLGCLRSHQAVLSAAAAAAFDATAPLLVLEDDAVFAEQLVLSHLPEPPAGWELAWLGGRHFAPPLPLAATEGDAAAYGKAAPKDPSPAKPPKDPSPAAKPPKDPSTAKPSPWYRPVAMIGTHAYLVARPEQAAAAIAEATAMKDPVNGTCTALSASSLVQYVHLPHLVGQDAGSSDIRPATYPRQRFWQPPIGGNT